MPGYADGMTQAPLPVWFDAHLDLAFLAETGRDMHVDPDQARGRYRPAAVTLPSLAVGGVGMVLATVFTEAVDDPSKTGAETGAFAYPLGDADAAYVSGMRQLKLYHAWRDAGVLHLPTAISPAELSHGCGPRAEDADARVSTNPVAPLTAGILVENADPISTPDDLELWRDGGVVAVGLTWMTRGRYACGNAVPSDEPGSGLTDQGRAFVARMDALGLVHDASHLNDRSLADLFDATEHRVVASHSNSRALFDPERINGGGNQRHLTDDAIREIVRRDGVIGLNLCSSFLDESCWETGRARLSDGVAHIEHVCEIAGNRDHVGLGSDMDGGFPASRLPEGIDTPADLCRLAEALRDRGWSDDDIARFTHTNWLRVFPALAGAREMQIGHTTG